jgi:2-keto-4-pentenoate hydratase/2-oxohepta-3-ene-1,7-dioic acid hydratase in catechol pathway
LKLLTFKHGGSERLGWLQDDGQTVLSVDPSDRNLPHTILDVIKRGPYARNQLISAAETLDKFQFDELDLLPPVEPDAIFGIGMNYQDHAEEVGAKKSEYPIVFLRLARNHVAAKQPLIVPTVTDTLDWEGELAVIIGKSGRHIHADDALSHVFGYSIYNEGTVRGFLNHTSQMGMGKNFQASASFGPVVVTADEFGDPYQHQIQTRLNGELMQNGSVSLMLHRIEDAIAYLSSGTELKPGDVICTGTPGGVGANQKPPRFLKDGETIEVSISGIGTLTNPVKAEPTELNAVACSC